MIDNIFTNNIEDNLKSKSGILINQIGHTDHQLVFTYQEDISYVENNEKYIKIVKKDEVSIQKFIDELKSLHIYEQLNHSVEGTSHDNYAIFSELLKYARKKHLPEKIVKLNKKKT